MIFAFQPYVQLLAMAADRRSNPDCYTHLVNSAGQHSRLSVGVMPCLLTHSPVHKAALWKQLLYSQGEASTSLFHCCIVVTTNTAWVLG